MLQWFAPRPIHSLRRYKLKLQTNSRHFLNFFDVFVFLLNPYFATIQTKQHCLHLLHASSSSSSSCAPNHFTICHDVCMWKIDSIWTPHNMHQIRTFAKCQWTAAGCCCCCSTTWMSSLCRGYWLLNFDDFCLYLLSFILFLTLINRSSSSRVSSTRRILFVCRKFVCDDERRKITIERTKKKIFYLLSDRHGGNGLTQTHRWRWVPCHFPWVKPTKLTKPMDLCCSSVYSSVLCRRLCWLVHNNIWTNTP